VISKVISYLKEKPIIIILLIASIVRLLGIWHDYPFSYNPDEGHFIKRSLSFGSGDFNPHWFHKPAFLMYLLFIEYSLFYLLGKMFSMFPNVDAFAVYYFKNAGPFILIGRITVALFGIATVYLIYKIGEKFWSKQTGIYASLLLALCYGHIFSGQDVKADVPTTFFSVLSMYYLLRVCGEGFKGSDYFFAGLFAGLGTATKYYSIVLLPCILLVVIYEAFRNRRVKTFLKFIYSLIAFWGIYFMVSPFNFLDPLGRRGTFKWMVKVWNTINLWKLDLYKLQGERSAEFLADNYKGSYIQKSIFNYLDVLFSPEGAGIVIGAIFALSLILFFRHMSIKKAALLSFPVLFSVISITMNPSYTKPRHQLIIYPFLAVIAGVVIFEVFGKIKNIKAVRITLGVMLIFPLFSIIANNVYMSKPDTRTEAKKWIETNIPSGTKMLVEESSVYISPDERYYKRMEERAKRHKKSQFARHADKSYHYSLMALPDITYNISYIRFPWWNKQEMKQGVYFVTSEYEKDMGNPLKPVGVEDYKYYVENKFQYVIVSSNKYENFLGNSDMSYNFPSFAKFYGDLFNNALLVKEFLPDGQRRRCPTIKIFKLVP
jgi:4-amino-4-deoxy-L-arabinose transferase-like glycosyltransferase